MHTTFRLATLANLVFAMIAGCGSSGSSRQPGGDAAIERADLVESGEAAAWPNVGVCGERGQATASVTTYDGYEEAVLFSEEGLGSEVCVVRFDLVRVGDAPHASGCMDTLDKACEWTHLLEFRNPQVLTDTDGVCSKSDLSLTPDAIATRVGSRVEIGFAKQFAGAHGSVRMKYFEAKDAWDVDGNATWDTSKGTFTYRYQNGFCNYGP
jgi:hypothetical protein